MVLSSTQRYIGTDRDKSGINVVAAAVASFGCELPVAQY